MVAEAASSGPLVRIATIGARDVAKVEAMLLNHNMKKRIPTFRDLQQTADIVVEYLPQAGFDESADASISAGCWSRCGWRPDGAWRSEARQSE
jgi:hypothetical protein